MRECKRSLVLILLKILGDAGLRVGQVVEDGLVAGFEHLRFETRPPALGLGLSSQSPGRLCERPGWWSGSRLRYALPEACPPRSEWTSKAGVGG